MQLPVVTIECRCMLQQQSHWAQINIDYIYLDGCSSESLPVTSGVPQGTVLDPLLFLCFVNDIPNCVSSNIRLYADDILLYRTINVMDDCVKLQDDLNALQQWEKGGKCTLIHQNVAISDYLTSNTSLIIIIIFIILFFKKPIL